METPLRIERTNLGKL